VASLAAASSPLLCHVYQPHPILSHFISWRCVWSASRPCLVVVGGGDTGGRRPRRYVSNLLVQSVHRPASALCGPTETTRRQGFNITTTGSAAAGLVTTRALSLSCNRSPATAAKNSHRARLEPCCGNIAATPIMYVYSACAHATVVVAW